MQANRAVNQELEDLFKVSVLPLKGPCSLRGRRGLLMSSGTHIFILCKTNQIPGYSNLQGSYEA